MNQKSDSLEEYLAKYRETHSEKDVQRLMHELEIRPAQRTYTFHKTGEVAPIHAGDMVLYRKVNKIKGDTKTEIFPAASIKYTEVQVSKKGVKSTERIWEIGIDENKIRKGKFCTRIASGCVQVVRIEKTDEYLKHVAEEIKKQ